MSGLLFHLHPKKNSHKTKIGHLVLHHVLFEAFNYRFVILSHSRISIGWEIDLLASSCIILWWLTWAFCKIIIKKILILLFHDYGACFNLYSAFFKWYTLFFALNDIYILEVALCTLHYKLIHFQSLLWGQSNYHSYRLHVYYRSKCFIKVNIMLLWISFCNKPYLMFLNWPIFIVLDFVDLF